MAKALIESPRWSPQGRKTVYAWRFPEDNLSKYSQVVVHESQEAVFYSKGQFADKFGPGEHQLNTENLPILRRLFGIPFGGKNPFMAEVWFVNTVERKDIAWRIGDIQYHDPFYNMPMPLEAKGTYGLRLVHAERFLKNLVGTDIEYTEEDLTNQFYGSCGEETISIITQYMMGQQINYTQIPMYVKTIGEQLTNALAPFWEEHGFELTQFKLTKIGIDESTSDGKTVAGMLRTGRTWQQEQMISLAKDAMNNLSKGSGGVVGGLMAINMMGGMGGGMMNPQYHQPAPGGQQNLQQQGQPQIREVYCSNCAKKFPNTHRFCPHCGDPYNPCPRCGTDNDQNAKRCISCGAPLQAEAATCPNCNTPLVPGSAFCGNCGKQLQTSDSNCSRCGTPLAPNIKFCPKCGNKRNT
jgi:membrane protease subunit (stomatin/prohibitin family)